MPDEVMTEPTWKDWDYETTHTVFCHRCQWEAQFKAPYWEAGDKAGEVYRKHWKETHGALQ